MFKKIKQFVSSDKNVSKFVFEKEDVAVEAAKNFLGFELKDEP